MKIPTNTWLALVETRKEGSDGVFELTARSTRAEAADVNRYLIEDCHLDGLEPRAIVYKHKVA